MKKYFIYAVSALALAGCSSDDFLGGQPSPTKLTDNNVINFNGDRSSTTRAPKSGSDAATKLGKMFFVYGTKWTNAEETNDQNGQTVYKNYLVSYIDGTANTTVSNTAGWEYVGVNNTFTSAVTPSIKGDQTIKYWDYSAARYVFYACSASEADLGANNGKVAIEKITDVSSVTKATVYDKGYKVTLKEGADVSKLYFSDRKVLTKNDNNGNAHGENDKYGGEVNLTFRNSMAKVRVGFYETIPGYKVSIDNFYKTENSQSTAVKDKFVADLTNTPLVMDATNGTNYIVTYYGSGHQLENQPKMVPETSNTTNVLALGKGLAANTVISTEKTNPTYDMENKGYTWFMPQTENDSKLKLKVDYTLTSTDDSGETIKVKGATAEVPAELLRWRPNYAYTYLFKISANTNGSTGGTGDPAGLYPITFDASVIETADGNAEYITTVSEASITTFAVDANGKYVNGANAKEYTDGSDIYATVVEGDALKTLVIAAQSGTVNTKVYKITDAYAPTANEAQVAEWIAKFTSLTSPTLDQYLTTYDTNVSVVSSVLSEDGKTISVNNALKLGTIAAGTYAIEYTNTTNAWTGTYNKFYKVIKVAAAPANP